MMERAILQRLREADPFPDPKSLQSVSPGKAVLLARIERRVTAMSTQQAPPIRPPASPGRRRGPLVAATAFVLVVAAIGLAVLVDRAMDTPVASNPLPVAEQWVDAMNNGDLEAALGLLSPETNCNLPIGSRETCRQHLGYLIAIGTHIETRSCAESAPYRCTYGLTSEFHAALGYPGHSLPLTTELTLDESGLLLGDLFSSVPFETVRYWPTESDNLWAFMLADYPELNIDLTFGPDPYTEAAGVAVMEAVRRFNDPARILSQLQDAFGRHSADELRRCTTAEGTQGCDHLMGFLASVDADLQLGCDVATAADGRITCPITIDSAIHQALGSGPSTTQATIEYRGGLAQTLELDLRFAADPAIHDAFMTDAATVDGLFTGGRPRWDAETAHAWVEAARAFAG